mgnify:CR=1 FL=1
MLSVKYQFFCYQQCLFKIDDAQGVFFEFFFLIFSLLFRDIVEVERLPRLWEIGNRSPVATGLSCKYS